MGIVGGANFPGLSYNYNQENKGTATMTSNNNSNYNNNNTSMYWQHQQSDNQGMETRMSYMPSSFRQLQSFQNQFVQQTPERQNIYPSTLRQYRQVQALPVCHPNQMSMLSNGLNRQSGSMFEPAQLEVLHMSSFHQAQNVTMANQMMPVGNMAQTVPLGFQPLQESTPQSQLTNSTEWVDRAYYRILQIKEMFLPDLLTLQKRSQELRQSANNAETLNKCEKMRMSVERVITFLSMPRSHISRWRKEKLFENLSNIVKYANQAKSSNAHAQKQSQLIVGPNNSVCSQNVIQSNNQAYAAHPNNLPQLNNKNVSRQLEFKPQNSVTAVSPVLNTNQTNGLTVKRQRNNKQQAVQRKKSSDQKKTRRSGGLINQTKPPLSPGRVVNSPQISLQLSSGIDLKDLSLPSSLSASAFPVSASPFSFPSPLSPSTPCSKPADFAKSPLSIDENCKFPPNSATPTLADARQNLIVADAHQGDIGSVENTESAEKQTSRDETIDPVQRLVNAVKSMSPRALSSAIHDMSAAISSTDRIATNFLHGGSTKIVFQDLADDIRYFRMQSETKDHMEIETRSCEISSAKRLKREPSDVLFQEIKEINQTFLEVKVDVMNTDDVSRIGFDDGVPIRCSYVPVGPASQHMIHKLLLELIVPADYPVFSPTVFEEMPRDCGDSEEGKYMWTKAKTNFSIKLRRLSLPITVKQMARAWETSARDVFVEYAQKFGGGSFSSTFYGMKMSGSGQDIVSAVNMSKCELV